jgi:hypothetical protein
LNIVYPRHNTLSNSTLALIFRALYGNHWAVLFLHIHVKIFV